MNATFSDRGDQMNVQVTEIMGQAAKDTCNVNLTTFGEFNLTSSTFLIPYSLCRHPLELVREKT